MSSGDPGALLSAFKAARLNGSGAEGCLAARALAAYCRAAAPCEAEALESAPGPICLYECFGYRVTGIEMMSVSPAGNGNLEAYLVIDLRKQGGESLPSNEAVVLGRGVATGQGAEQPTVIVDASTSV